MTDPLDPRTRALFLPAFLAPEIADAFVRTLWNDLQAGRLSVRTHKENLLRKNAIEVHGSNYAPLLALHWGLTPLASRILDTELLPSLIFFRIYFAGDICRIHDDRSASQVNLSLTLATGGQQPWALCVGTRYPAGPERPADDFGDEAYERYPMGTGDALLYLGAKRRHGRPEPNPNRWSAHVFLSWVEREGPHRDEAFELLNLGPLPGF